MRWQDFNFEKHKKDLEQFYNENPTWENLSQVRDFENFDEYMERVTRLPSRPFAPTAFYNEHGDMLEMLLSNNAAYGKWLTPNITLMLDFETHEIVGCKIYGVKNMVNSKCNEVINSENGGRDFGDENDYTEKKLCINCNIYPQQNHSPYCQCCSWDGK